MKQPEVGDWADHKSGDLDPRQVTRVSADGGLVWLYMLTAEAGPFPAANYNFEKEQG